jgi:undecaprenyl-diphosphatase
VALWGDVKNFALGIFKKNENGKLAWRIIAVSIPVLFLGWFLNDWVEKYFRSPFAVVISLVFWGLVLWWADARVKESAENHLEKVGLKQIFLIGLSQVIAFIPGTSRSGITISAGLFSGLSRETAARFSFLLGVPAIAAAGGYSLLKIIGSGEAFNWSALIIAFITAFVSGFLAIRFLLKIMKASSYKWFVIYRIVLAAIILFFFV